MKCHVQSTGCVPRPVHAGHGERSLPHSVIDSLAPRPLVLFPDPPRDPVGTRGGSGNVNIDAAREERAQRQRERKKARRRSGTAEQKEERFVEIPAFLYEYLLNVVCVCL